MHGTAFVYPFDGLTTREQVILLYQFLMTVHTLGLRFRRKPHSPRIDGGFRDSDPRGESIRWLKPVVSQVLVP